MDKNLTLLEEKKTVKAERPRRSVIQNILNYSKSLQVVPTTLGVTLMLINN
jgi:hypothetical protein